MARHHDGQGGLHGANELSKCVVPPPRTMLAKDATTRGVEELGRCLGPERAQELGVRERGDCGTGEIGLLGIEPMTKNLGERHAHDDAVQDQSMRHFVANTRATIAGRLLERLEQRLACLGIARRAGARRRRAQDGEDLVDVTEGRDAFVEREHRGDERIGRRASSRGLGGERLDEPGVQPRAGEAGGTTQAVVERGALARERQIERCGERVVAKSVGGGTHPRIVSAFRGSWRRPAGVSLVESEMSPTEPPDPPPGVLAWTGTDLGRKLLELPSRWFHARIEGTEGIPGQGGALLVGNHALFGLDGVVLGTLVYRTTGRWVRFLGERNLFKIPIFSQMLLAVGALPGEPGAATSLLRDGELVGVYPGGVDDSFKLSSERHRLKWGHRAGFAKVAMRAKVPIFPVAGIGIDDMYDVVAREKWIGRTVVGSPRYDLPIAFGAYGTLLPKRAPQHYVVLPPVDTSGDPENADEVERVRTATYDAIQARLREG
jgi:1-acyl-sn-glycerol-3-phosphate acyltransferase